MSEPTTAFAQAWNEAEARQAAAEEERRRKEEAAALEAVALHVYDPRPYPEAVPHDPTLYEGAGIAVLYDLPGGERFLPELGDWMI
jgi:hypothetical protein